MFGLNQGQADNIEEVFIKFPVLLRIIEKEYRRRKDELKGSPDPLTPEKPAQKRTCGKRGASTAAQSLTGSFAAAGDDGQYSIFSGFDEDDDNAGQGDAQSTTSGITMTSVVDWPAPGCNQ